MRWSVLPPLLLALQVQSPAAKPDCEADVFVLQDLEKQPAIASPDGRYGITLAVASEEDRRGEIRFHENSRLLATYRWDDLSAGVFVKWSDDSRAVYVDWSNGGMIGGYELRVFRIDDGIVRELPSSTPAETEFDSEYPCKRSYDNVYAVRWLDGSREMLLAPEADAHSDCGTNLGLIRGYRVLSNNGAIIERYSKRRLKSLAPPTCPSPIYPTGALGFRRPGQSESRTSQKMRRLRVQRAADFRSGGVGAHAWASLTLPVDVLARVAERSRAPCASVSRWRQYRAGLPSRLQRSTTTRECVAR